jgi:hypothetical protein
MIRIERKGVIYTCDTVEEAERLGKLLEGKSEGLQGGCVDLEASADPVADEPAEGGLVFDLEASADPVADEPAEFAWTPEICWRFYKRLGEPQQKLLHILVEQDYVSDEFLREQLGITTNQQLAGLLSGISKQALAIGIPPRKIFKIESIRRVGSRQSLYFVDHQLAAIAKQTLDLRGGPEEVPRARP